MSVDQRLGSGVEVAQDGVDAGRNRKGRLLWKRILSLSNDCFVGCLDTRTSMEDKVHVEE